MTCIETYEQRWELLKQNTVILLFMVINSRRMTKPTKWPVRPAKTQIRLGVRPVWSESSLSAWRNLWALSYPLSTQRRLLGGWAGGWCWLASSAGASCYICTFTYSRARACCACGRCGTGGLYFFIFFICLPFLMSCLLGDGWTWLKYCSFSC